MNFQTFELSTKFHPSLGIYINIYGENLKAIW